MSEAEEMDPASVVFSCCYCARILDDETPDWIGVSIYDKDTGNPGQMWFAHELCFRKTLHPDYDLIDPDLPEWIDEGEEP